MIQENLRARWKVAYKSKWFYEDIISPKNQRNYFKDFCPVSKGELISKANCQAMDSSKKRTNEFVFTTMQHVFVCFLEESMA